MSRYLIAALLLTACSTGTDDGNDPTPTPDPPVVCGTITADPAQVTVEPGAKLWVGFFTEDAVDDLGIPINPDQPSFGVQYTDPVLPFAYCMDGIVGSFFLVAGLDTNDDGLFCEGEWIGHYREDNGMGDEERALVSVGEFGVAEVNADLDISVPSIFQPDECP